MLDPRTIDGPACATVWVPIGVPRHPRLCTYTSQGVLYEVGLFDFMDDTPLVFWPVPAGWDQV